MAKATITSGQDFDSLKMAAPAAVAAGDIVVIGGRVLVAYSDAAQNAQNVYVHEARLEAPKAAVAIASGATLYWDAAANVFTTVAVGNTKCGMAIEPALAGDALVQIAFTNEVNI